MTDIVKGMAGAYLHALNGPDDLTVEEAMRAALMWFSEQLDREGKHFVAAEVRAAAGEEGK